MQDALNILWIDLRVDQDAPAALDQLREFFRVTDCGYTESIGAELKANMPDALFVDFDYPDRAGLRLLQDLKVKFPSMPLLMGTVQHSEELAVWAFRSGALDFFVKPVPADELRRCEARIREIRQQKRRQSARRASLGGANLPAEATPGHSTDRRALEPALHYISQNFRSKILRDEAAALCAMNPFRFSRRFKEAFGISFREFVVRQRISEACRLLESPSASITSVAFAVGFNDVGYFSRMFKHHTGLTPTAMKREVQGSRASQSWGGGPQELAVSPGEDTQARLSALPPLPVH